MDYRYELAISHTGTALVAFRFDENQNRNYLGMVIRLSESFLGVCVPPACYGGCRHAGECTSKVRHRFTDCQEAVDWVFSNAGMLNVPQDLKMPEAFAKYDKRLTFGDGWWNGGAINYISPPADQKSIEPPFTGKEPPIVKAGSHYEERPRRHRPGVKPVPTAARVPAKPAPAPVVVEAKEEPRKKLTIEEALDAAMQDLGLKEEKSDDN